MCKLTNQIHYFIFLSSLLILSCGNESQFKSLDPSYTGIHFSNRIIESDTVNILKNEYIYNGGGVGIADFNKDGLEDVFFTANMTPDRLYLNQGEFKFKEITTEAGIDDKQRWSSGVAVVDVNADAWPDIYVCATNRTSTHQRTNMLWVNQGLNERGIPTFKNMALEYGLADTSHSTMAAFFDYDNDGDLDMYLAINEMDKTKLPNKYRPKIVDGSSQRTDKLFQNNWSDSLGHPIYTDVSKSAGILIEGFSLGLNIVDINQDGWKDIYVTNDYMTNDLLYINQQDGTFVNEAAKYFKHTSHSAMGNDVVDINNDALVDVIAVDMMPEDNYRRKTMLVGNNYTSYYNNERFGYEYQYVRNTLQLNGGKKPGKDEQIFSEISMFSGVSATDWSWAPLVADFDNDGFRDMIVTNGFPKDITDRDFMDYHTETQRFASQDFLLEQIPSVKLKNYAYRNKGDLSFENVTEKWGIDVPSFSNGAASVDLDNDGDLDYIVNNIDDSAFVYKNLSIEQHSGNANWLKVGVKGTAKDPQGFNATIEIHYGDGQKQFWENTPYRGYLSSIQTGAHFGLGIVDIVDSLIVYYQNRKKVLENIAVNQVLKIDINESDEFLPPGKDRIAPTLLQQKKDSSLIFIHEEGDFIDFNTQPLLPHKLSQYGPGMAVSDINNDGLFDFYIGGDHFHKGTFFIQQPDGSFSQEDLLPKTKEIKFKEEELGILFFDADKDGDEDLYLVSGGYEEMITSPHYQDRLFLNEKGTFILAENALPPMPLSGSCVRAADYDRDGDLDVFVGGRVLPGKYPTPVSSYLLKNDSDKNGVKFNLSEDAPILNEIGMVCDALWTDFDNDSWVDLMIGGEWLPLTFLKNHNGKLAPVENSTLAATSGWWNSLSAADFDQDGDTDYIAGNLGLNTLNRVDNNGIVGIYAADFDENGGIDAIPTASFKDTNGNLQEFPYLGRSDMIKQLIAVKGQYLKYSAFAKAPISEIISLQKNQDSIIHYQAKELRSSYLENLGNGKFNIHPLPLEAQLSPIYGIISKDINEDGFTDVILVGNDYGNEVSMGRYDAFNGLVLAGNGKGDFKPISTQASGFYVPEDAKSLIHFPDSKENQVFVAAQNRGPLQSFQKSLDNYKILPLEWLDAYAKITLKNGTTYKIECFYGSGYLSQSARVFYIPKDADKVVVFDYSGNSRVIK